MLDVLATAIQKEKNDINRERSKSFPILQMTWLFTEDTLERSLKIVKSDEHIQLSEYKINTQKPVAFLYKNDSLGAGEMAQG